MEEGAALTRGALLAYSVSLTGSVLVTGGRCAEGSPHSYCAVGTFNLRAWGPVAGLEAVSYLLTPANRRQETGGLAG